MATTPATADAAEPPSPEPSGMPLSIVSSMPKSSPRVVDHRRHGHAGGVPLELQRQVRDDAGDGGDADAAGRGPRRVDAVAREVRAVAEDVEADRHVADARRREGHGATASPAHKCAPR